MKVWKSVSLDRSWAGQISQKLQVPQAVADILGGLGFPDLDAVGRFLNPRLSDLTDPFLIPGMEPAVRRVWQALDHGETIAVYGDYDVDGITSTGLLTKVLEALGAARVIPCLPSRLDEGYGLSPAALTRCIRASHPQLLLTVDCGTNAVEAAQLAAQAGLDIIITDHHEVSGDLPAVLAIVNPKLGTTEDLKMLAGVGVVFKLCHALVKDAKRRGRSEVKGLDLREYLDWVTVGTVADIVPLRKENRILVRHGLARLNQSATAGWKALIEVAGLRKAINTRDIAFGLGPRLNAAGRLSNAELALELLLTSDARRARDIALELDSANRERQNIEATILREAQAELDASFDPASHFGLVVGRRGWHPGVIGIVASRLAVRYRRPTVVIAFNEDGTGRGSCRSIEGYPLLQGLEQCRSHLITFGGHDMAAGLAMESRHLESFRMQFNEVAARELKRRDLSPVQPVHAWLDLDQVNDELLENLERMEPFGQDNPKPVLAVHGVKLALAPQKVGTNHLRLTLAAGATRRSAIWFGSGDQSIPEGPLDIAFCLQRNTYQGTDSLQLTVQDIRPTCQP